MTFTAGSRCPRFCQHDCISLIVDKHLQTNVHVVDLNAQHPLRLQSSTIYGSIAHEMTDPVTAHAYHLVVKLLHLADSSRTVAEQLPVSVGLSQIVQRKALIS